MILPNAAFVGLAFGAARFVWLSAFRNSARNGSLILSGIEKLLIPDIFHKSTAGPLTPEKRVGVVTRFEASWSASVTGPS